MAPDVLIVEDDEAIAESLTELISDSGYRVERADNGRVALDFLRSRGKPRLILLDLMMPEMDGIQFLAEKAADAALRPIPVIVMSADAQRERKVDKSQIQGFLRKPLEIDSILRAVEEHTR